MKKLLAFIGLLGVCYALAVQHGVFDRKAAPNPVAAAAETQTRAAVPGHAGNSEANQAAPAATARSAGNCNDDALANAYRNHQSRVEVCGRGVISRVLKDDLEGSRHQRFIVRLPPGRTLLIAYNIDLAPRIDGLRAGSPIEFTGEYEWNGQGGVVHWTHHDPGGRHPAGWIRYEGRVYQ
jgi:uncharacterized protein DUF3465